MGYFVAIVSVFLAVSALTALRPGRKGIFQFLAYPVGWAAGELAGQAFILQCALVGLLVWWGWPSSSWLGEVVVIVAAVVVGANAILIGDVYKRQVFVAPMVSWMFAWIPIWIAAMVRDGFFEGIFVGLFLITFGWMVIGFLEFAVLFIFAAIFRFFARLFRHAEPNVIILGPDER